MCCIMVRMGWVSLREKNIEPMTSAATASATTSHTARCMARICVSMGVRLWLHQTVSPYSGIGSDKSIVPSGASAVTSSVSPTSVVSEEK